MTLVERGELELATTARSVLGDDLPLIDDRVTVEHLLTHRSGIGDYLDEEAVEAPTEYVMPVPVHQLAGTEDYCSVLAGHRQVFAPGERFAYNNSGFVVLALIAERVSGIPFELLVRGARVRSPPACATRRSCARTSRPVVPPSGISTSAGSGPTCCTCRCSAAETAGSTRRRPTSARSGWRCSRAGSCRVDRVAEMVRPRSDVPSESMRYGLGLWIHRTGSAVVLEGSDAGVSFRTLHDPVAQLTYTVLSNTTAGAWPIARHLDEHPSVRQRSSENGG